MALAYDSPVAELMIRKVGPADAAFVARLVTELGYPATADETRGRIERLDRDGQDLFVAELEGELAGFAATQIYPVLVQDAPVCRLAALVVAERFRRRGIGRALILAVEQEGRRSGCDRVVLESALRRDEAHGFYRSLEYEGTANSFQKRL